MALLFMNKWVMSRRLLCAAEFHSINSIPFVDSTSSALPSLIFGAAKKGATAINESIKRKLVGGVAVCLLEWKLLINGASMASNPSNQTATTENKLKLKVI